MKLKKSTGGLGRYLIGVAGSLLLLVISSFVAALIAESSGDPTAKIGSFSLISLLFSAALSGVFLSRVHGSEGVKIAALTALASALIMMLLGVIITGGKLTSGSFMNYGCYLGVSLVFAYLGRKKEKKHRRRHR